MAQLDWRLSVLRQARLGNSLNHSANKEESCRGIEGIGLLHNMYERNIRQEGTLCRVTKASRILND